MGGVRRFVERRYKALFEKSALDDLSRIAIKHGTDKFGGHLYTPIYERLFRPLRYRPIRLLEIGVGGYGSPLAGGLSLSAWAEYFPNAMIVGLDVEEKRLANAPRITIVKAAQDDVIALEDVWKRYGPFDIIIDDGSHLPGHVLTSFRYLYPKMTESGLYVVEDTQTSLWPDFLGAPDGRSTIFELAYHIGLAMHSQEVEAGGRSPEFLEFGSITHSVQIYRNLIVFERGDNTYPSNASFNFDHPQVAQIHDLIVATGARQPSPGVYLILIVMAVQGKRTDEAVALAREVVTRYPDRTQVLAFAHDFFDRFGYFEDRCRAARSLIRLHPEDPWTQRLNLGDGACRST